MDSWKPTNLQKLRDFIVSIWTKISEECFQHLVESIPWELRQFWRQKRIQPGTRKLYLIKWPVSVYMGLGYIWFCDWITLLTRPALRTPTCFGRRSLEWDTGALVSPLGFLTNLTNKTFLVCQLYLKDQCKGDGLLPRHNELSMSKASWTESGFNTLKYCFGIPAVSQNKGVFQLYWLIFPTSCLFLSLLLCCHVKNVLNVSLLMCCHWVSSLPLFSLCLESLEGASWGNALTLSVSLFLSLSSLFHCSSSCLSSVWVK